MALLGQLDPILLKQMLVKVELDHAEPGPKIFLPERGFQALHLRVITKPSNRGL